MNECIAPEEIREGELLAFAEGEAPPAVRDHVARCPACAEEAASLQQMNLLFAAAYYRAECPESELLLRYQAGLLAPAENKRVQRHVKSCQDCQAELVALAGESPPSALNRLGTAVSQSLKEIGRQVIEAVLLPNQMQPALALRGESQQHAVYQAGPYQIILAKVPPVAVRNVWQVEGQLTGDDSEEMNGRVSLQRGEELVASDNLDEFGFFALEEVPPGRYTLQIEVASSLVSLADLTIP
jgi:anti-sigma factor RsiW